MPVGEILGAISIPEISAALTSIKTASDLVGLIRMSGASLEAAEQKLKLAELTGALADVKIKVARLDEILVERNAEIARLRNIIDTKATLSFEAPYYWTVNDVNKDGPFCATCQDDRGKLIRLQALQPPGLWRCAACKGTFKDSSFV